VALGRADFRARVLRLARAAFRAASPDRLHVRARFGFDDPADTGALYGVIAGLAAAAPHLRRDWRVDAEPSWIEPALEGDAELQWSIRPASVIGPIVAFVLSPATIRTAVAVWRTR
jgi:hypothetical protein